MGCRGTAHQSPLQGCRQLFMLTCALHFDGVTSHSCTIIGLGVLVVDFVSEESLPGLLPVPANNDNNDDNTDEKTALETLTWKALRGNNFLTGKFRKRVRVMWRTESI